LTWPGLGCSESRAATLAISEAGLSRELRVEGCNRDALDARFVASVARQEEKGSDFNVASRLLIDTLTGTIDAAVVINNDSDLAYPIACARERLPVGLVNPTKGYRAGKLAGLPHEGARSHWWYQLRKCSSILAPPCLGEFQRTSQRRERWRMSWDQRRNRRGLEEVLTNLWMVLPGRGLLARGLVWAATMKRNQPAKCAAPLTD
jgi:hypothetical protein